MSSNPVPVNLLVRAGLSQLIIVDMQTRLMAAMPNDGMPAAIKNVGILAQASAMLDVPVIITEQYAKGLGNTVPEILALLPPGQVICHGCVPPVKTTLITAVPPGHILWVPLITAVN